MTAFSIIVPVYNSEQFLGETLDSLLGQTFGDFEIICVNDGSTDGSAEILQTYARKDSRVRTFSQENQGVSVARNNAMARAKGDILMFVDADDTLLPHALERVHEVFKQHDPEMLTFGLACDPPEAAPASLRRELSPKNKVYDGFAPSLLFKDYARPYACRTAIARAFALRENVRFEPGIALGEDQVFYFATYPFSKKTVLLDEKLYIYRMNASSATHASTSGRELLLKKLDQHLMVEEAILRLWQQRDMRAFCAPELLEWCLDLLMLDVSKLPPRDQRDVYRRLMAALDGHFPAQTETYAKRLPTKRCLADIRAALEAADAHNVEAPVIRGTNLKLFYLMRRGFARCAERMLMRLGIVK